MIFKIDENNKAVLNPEIKKLCKSLQKLDEQRFLFIVMAYDYDSPFHRFPEDERKRKAKLYALGASDADMKEDKLFKDAVEEYCSFQYDIRKEAIRVYEQKIIQLNIALFNEQIARKIGEYDSAIQVLMDRIEKLQQQIDSDEEAERIIKGDGKVTMIEKYQLNAVKSKDAQKTREQATGVVNI